LLVSLATRRSGALTIDARRAGRSLGRCALRAPARRSITCSIALRKGLELRGITITIRLRAQGRLLATRSARISGVSTTAVDGLRRVYCTLR
jgi:hypothetical protein